MTKNAIFIINIGNHQKFVPGIKSAHHYSKKIGADLYLATEPAINFKYIHFEKFQLFGLFTQGYDRVLMLDADILVNPKAPDIFEAYPKTDTLYAFEENMNVGRMDRDVYVEAVKEDIDWKRNEDNGKYQYFNAGVVIISKPYAGIIINNFTDIPDVPLMWSFPEQTCLNYIVQKFNIPYERIDRTWNFFDLDFDEDVKERFNANFIHYAGPCWKFTGDDKDKYETLAKDYKKFYGDS